MGTCRRGARGGALGQVKSALHPGFVHWWLKAPSRTLKRLLVLYLACSSAHLWSLGQEGGGYLGSPLRDRTLKGTARQVLAGKAGRLTGW